MGTATQWLFNFVFSQITPHAVNNLKWRTFLMFAIFNWALVIYVWLFIKEVSLKITPIVRYATLLIARTQTKGKSLEEMELIFNAKHTQLDLEQVHHKSGQTVEHVEDQDAKGRVGEKA